MDANGLAETEDEAGFGGEVEFAFARYNGADRSGGRAGSDADQRAGAAASYRTDSSTGTGSTADQGEVPLLVALTDEDRRAGVDRVFCPIQFAGIEIQLQDRPSGETAG
jgi:hypothetical protein